MGGGVVPTDRPSRERRARPGITLEDPSSRAAGRPRQVIDRPMVKPDHGTSFRRISDIGS
jgi:hypothetical protein